MDTNTVTPAQVEDAHEEEIHMPPPSWSPIILALGMTLLVFGVSLASIVFVPMGAVLILIGLGTWIYDEIKNASAHDH
ncbi:MAG: cytochrome c oxidase subunit 4 [Thermoflexales bacterium]